MAGTIDGGWKGAATRIGVSYALYRQKRTEGKLWCSAARHWTSVGNFGKASESTCLRCRSILRHGHTDRDAMLQYGQEQIEQWSYWLQSVEGHD